MSDEMTENRPVAGGHTRLCPMFYAGNRDHPNLSPTCSCGAAERAAHDRDGLRERIEALAKDLAARAARVRTLRTTPGSLAVAENFDMTVRELVAALDATEDYR